MTQNNDKKYFIEIIPTGYYFFGSERTFNTNQQDKYGEEVTNYFAESNPLPQQTAVLGLLRHTLLALYDKLDDTNELKNEIIGKEHFSLTKDSDYGLIKEISPLVIFNTKDAAYLIPAGFKQQQYDGENIELVYQAANETVYSNQVKTASPMFSNLDYKKGIDTIWKDAVNNKYCKDDIFKTITKVGVDKNKPDEAFYKQTFYGLNNNFSFGVWVNFTDTLDEAKLKDILMPFGADQGLFKLTFRTDVQNPFETMEALKEGEMCKEIILLSDTWVEEDLFDNIDFGITQFSDFRYIETNTSKYYTPTKSLKKYSLLKQGSVLYPNKTFDFNILNKPAFKRIGYNYFATI
jgi:CRISPR-associated protein Cmr3